PGVRAGPGAGHDRVEVGGGHARVGQHLPDGDGQQFALAAGVDRGLLRDHPLGIADGDRHRGRCGIEGKDPHRCPAECATGAYLPSPACRRTAQRSRETMSLAAAVAPARSSVTGTGPYLPVRACGPWNTTVTITLWSLTTTVSRSVDAPLASTTCKAPNAVVPRPGTEVMRAAGRWVFLAGCCLAPKACR